MKRQVLSRRRWIKTGLIFCPALVLPHDRVRCSSFLPIQTLTQDAYLWAYKTVPGNSGSVSAQTIMRVNGFVQAVLPIRAKLLRLNLYVGNNLGACLSPVFNDIGFTTDSNPGFIEANFSEATGLTNDGSKWSSLGFNTSSLGTDDSLHLGTYTLTKTGVYGGSIGSSDNTNYDYYSHQSGISYGNMHSAGNFVSIVDGGIGHYVASRIASNDLQLYKNGVSVSSQASPGGTRIGNYNVLVGAINYAAIIGAKQFGASAGYHAGTGLTASNVTLLYNALQAFNTLYGRQV